MAPKGGGASALSERIPIITIEISIDTMQSHTERLVYNMMFRQCPYHMYYFAKQFVDIKQHISVNKLCDST